MIHPIKIQVRFSDCDMMGHVNNAIYLNYFESTRMYYFGQLLDQKWDWQKDGIVLLKNELTYHKPVLLHDTPMITLHTEEIGTKSFVLSYELKVNDEIRCTGKSTIVCYNSVEHKSIEIPAGMKTALNQLKK